MSTLSKRTLLMLLVLSVSFGSIFAEGQADMFDNDDNSFAEDMDSPAIGGDEDNDDVEDGFLYGFSGNMRNGKGRGKGMSAQRGRGNGELKYVDEPGVLVTDVFVDSPADSAGILRGDVILSIEGIDVSTIHDITLALDGYEHGETISLVLLRAENEVGINLTLETKIGYPLIGITGIGTENGNRNGMGDFDNHPMQPFDMPFFRGEMMPGFGPGFMFDFEDGDEGDLSVLDIPEEVVEAVLAGNAALITEVVEGSPAGKAGVSENMVVIALNGVSLDEGDLSSAVLAYEIGETVELTLADMSGVSTLDVELGDNDGNPFLGVAYIPLSLGGQGFGMPFDMPGKGDGVFQARPDMFIPKMNNN
jgi:membrane-associated protease RseP (regulator of RpoE activity)